MLDDYHVHTTYSDDSGYPMEEAKALLKGIGFRSFCTYENMQPIFHGL